MDSVECVNARTRWEYCEPTYAHIFGFYSRGGYNGCICKLYIQYIIFSSFWRKYKSLTLAIWKGLSFALNVVGDHPPKLLNITWFNTFGALAIFGLWVVTLGNLHSTGRKDLVLKVVVAVIAHMYNPQSWALSVFFNFFIDKNWLFAFFITLIWLGVDFFNRTGAEIGY